jgi:beta-glucuronidase
MSGICTYASQSELVTNIDGRKTVSLNGKWKVIIDPFETGYYDYRYLPAAEGFFKNTKAKSKSDRIEYSFDTGNILNVPGDWNTQREMLFFYEGTIWYKKSFDYNLKPSRRLFLYFGAANYKANVYLNGTLLGENVGGFTPFNFEITNLVRPKDNFVIAKVDNKRSRDAVPTVNFDWHNYGGLTRRVTLIDVPQTTIMDYFIQLKKGTTDTVAGWVRLDGPDKEQDIIIEIPKAQVKKNFRTNSSGYAEFSFRKELELWSPENPRLYEVIVKAETDSTTDYIGFRSIYTRNTKILLNGESVYLRGICIHEEAPFTNGGRAFSKEHARTVLGWAKELGCNFVRLAHYPHNEHMVRTADEMGLMVWSEIPVYWTILWENKSTLENAKNQLAKMITRDKNRASIIFWSMANETPLSKPRLIFLKNLAAHARSLDSTRLITAAMEKHYVNDKTLMIDDPFCEFVDVLGCNEYVGWYDGLPEKCAGIEWKNAYDKPVVITEFGGGALYGYHGDDLTRWTEEFQESLYRHNIEMLSKVPFIKGLSPWILKDFRSPKRLLPRIQDYWNRKGLISDQGQKKKAFYILQDFYRNKAKFQK